MWKLSVSSLVVLVQVQLVFHFKKETVNKYTAQSNDALLWEKVLDLDVPIGF